MSSDDSEDECELGKHEHWENCYTKELANFTDHGDTGEVWFGEEVLNTMIAWTDELLHSQRTHPKELSILDLGTGNGLFLIRLAALGYTNLSGCDYSAASIKLARTIAAQAGARDIQWLQDNLLESGIQDRFQVLTDKGTLDAVGLSADAATNRVKYRHSVWNLLQPGGLLIVTSCNSTSQELKEELCQQDAKFNFKYVDMVKTYPVFHFGGLSGTKVCTLTFERVEDR